MKPDEEVLNQQSPMAPSRLTEFAKSSNKRKSALEQMLDTIQVDPDAEERIDFGLIDKLAEAATRQKEWDDMQKQAEVQDKFSSKSKFEKRK